MRRWTRYALATVVWLTPVAARAERPVELTYTGPPGCGSSDEVRRKLSDALAHGDGNGSGEETDPVPLSARVAVTGESPRYQLDFEAADGDVTSRRRLIVDSCEAVTEAAALLLLLAIDPVQARALGVPENADAAAGSTEGDAPTAPPAPAPDEGVKPAPVVERREPDERAPSSERAPSDGDALGGTLGLGAGLVHGMTPRTALGPVAGGGLRLGRLGLLGRVGWHRAFSADLPGVEGGSIEADLLRADLRAAVHFGTRRFEFGPAAGVGIDRMHARSLGVEAPGDGATSWPTLSGGMTLNASISEPWGIAAGAGLVIPLARPDFLVAGEAEVAHEPARFGWEASIGISWAFHSQF